MDLTLQEVARLLQVSEEMIHHWLGAGKIPSYVLNGEYRFSREEIESWIIHSLKPEDLCPDLPRSVQPFAFYRALYKGTVLYDAEGETKEEVLQKSVADVAAFLHVDADVLYELLSEREKLMPTALNKGVAVPHARDFLLPESYDVIVPVFLEKAIDYGALDGEPVHTLFFLFASDDRRHLHLLGKIAYFCTDPSALEFLKGKPSKQDLLLYVKAWESGLCRLQTV